MHFKSEVSQCLAQQTQVSDAPEFVAGTFVWTLHDYMGEPGAFPHVSSSFGAIDLAGFAKPPAWWYRSVWLSAINASDAGRPPLKHDTTVRIVENWEAPKGEATTRTIHVYSNAASVSLELNGKAVGGGAKPVADAPLGFASFDVGFEKGTLTAKAMEGSTVLATHSVHSWGKAAAINLTMVRLSLLNLERGTQNLYGHRWSGRAFGRDWHWKCGVC